MIRPTRAVVSLGAIRHNTRVVLNLIGRARKLLVMVKADAYGHGALRVASAAVAEGASFLGVALVEEGIALRERGIRAPILVFNGVFPQYAPVLVEHDLTPVVSSLELAEALNTAAIAASTTRPIHIDVDTGMGRIGFRVEDPATLPAIRAIASMKGLSIQGVMTHFSSADDTAGLDYTWNQHALFRKALRDMAASGIRPALTHAANTAAILCHPDCHESMVRLGLGLYGYYPCREAMSVVELKPSLELVSSIVHVKTCPPGSHIGYGRTFTTGRASRIATIPMGYADGYPRELSNVGSVIVVGKNPSMRTVCPVIGRVCMDDILVDVTDAPGASVADTVVIYSGRRQDPNSVESTAELLKTIPYVLTTRLTARVPRVHVEE